MSSTKLLYKENIINVFCKLYGIYKEELVKNNCNNINYFRYICFKYNDFMRNIELPKIPKKSIFEAVLIEFHIFPHLEFLIRNSINQLGEKWAHTIICGNLNYEFISKICQKISININIIKLNVDDMDYSEYNIFLTSLSFWDILYGNKILFYQEDSIILNTNIDDFIRYDYIGTPFEKYQNDTYNLTGNCRFSLRTKSIMIKILNTISPENTILNNSTLQYMKKYNLTFPPEDVYYYKNAQEFGIGLVADYDMANLFSCHNIFNENIFGTQCFWVSDNKWKNKLKNVFNYRSYMPNSDINKYLKICKLDVSYNKTNINKNAFDVDLFFCDNVNNLKMKDNNEIIKYIQLIGINGFIYHPKQIINIFPTIKLYRFLNDIYIMHQLKIYTANNFIDKFLYNSTYNDIHNILIRNRYDNLNPNCPVLLLVFIGNEERGNDLLNKIIQYKNIEKFNVSFCFNLNGRLADKMKTTIKDNFEFYSVYECKECGTDITPTLLMYDDISKKYTFNHIIKLQSKTIIKAYNELTDFVLSKPIDKLRLFKNNTCNCIGHPNYYIELKEDIFNNELKLNNISDINIHNSFVGGTIFYSENWVFQKTLQFMKQKYKIYLFNNLYENNSINVSNSPIHFLERVFGAIQNTIE
jgi:hypothetical protein